MKNIFNLIEDRRIRLNKISKDFEKDEKITKTYTIDIHLQALRDYLTAMDNNWESDLEMIERFKYL